MKTKIIYVIAGVIMGLFCAGSCKKAHISPELTVSNITDTIPAGGATVPLAFTCNDVWSIDTTGIGWLHVSQVSGTSGAANINLSAA